MHEFAWFFVRQTLKYSGILEGETLFAYDGLTDNFRSCIALSTITCSLFRWSISEHTFLFSHYTRLYQYLLVV